MEKEYVPFDLIDVGLAFWVGASPTIAGVLCLLAQYTVRHNDEVREAIVGGAQKALPVVREKALTAKSLIAQEQRSAPPAPQEPAAPPAPLAETDLSTDQGVLDTLAGKHHLLVVGHTGGGKSVLLHNLAKRLSATASVLVCDVDSVRGTYQGYRVVGAGDDYDAISSALQLVRKEVGKRREARAAGTRAFKAMWVVIDEAHDVFASVDFARELFIDVVRRGRKLNIHMAIGTQDSLVKTLGLEGQSKALVNLTRVDVTTRGQQRTASIDGNEYPVPDLPHPDDMVQQTSPDRSSRPVQTSPDQSNNDLLGALLKSGLGQSDGVDHPTPDQSSRPVQTSPQTGPDQSRPVQQTGPDQGQTTPDLEQTIRDKLVNGQSKNQIWEWLKEQGVTKSKDKAYKMINAAKENAEPPSGLLGNYLGDRTEEEL